MKSRLLSEPKDYTFDELATLLKNLGYVLNNSGKTSGSGVKFVNPQTKHIMNLHKPHPSPVLKSYEIKRTISRLKQGGLL
jgi:hypothetical protein